MGQYHYVMNLDKKQFLHPHKLGDGLKLMEFGDSRGGTMTALALLLGCSARDGGRGGGDPRVDAEGIVGSWAGDRIAIVGDYAEDDDIKGYDEIPVSQLYGHAAFTDISEALRPLVEANTGVAIRTFG